MDALHCQYIKHADDWSQTMLKASENKNIFKVVAWWLPEMTFCSWTLAGGSTQQDHRHINAPLMHFSSLIRGPRPLRLSPTACKHTDCARRPAHRHRQHLTAVRSPPLLLMDYYSFCCCCCHDEPVRHCLYGGTDVPKRWGIPPDSHSPGTHLWCQSNHQSNADVLLPILGRAAVNVQSRPHYHI